MEIGSGAGLTAAERARLARMLAMLASPHDGERAAAAFLASDFVARRGLAWTDVTRLLGPVPPVAPVSATPDRRKPGGSWRGYCRRRPVIRGGSVDCVS